MNAASSTGAGRMEAEKLAQTRMNSIDTLPQAQDPTPTLAARADHSRYVQRVRRVRGDSLAWLPPGEPVRETMEAALQTVLAQGRPLASALRIVRQLVMERLVVLDVEQQASVETVTRAMTELAEVTLEANPTSVEAARLEAQQRRAAWRLGAPPPSLHPAAAAACSPPPPCWAPACPATAAAAWVRRSLCQ